MSKLCEKFFRRLCPSARKKPPKPDKLPPAEEARLAAAIAEAAAKNRDVSRRLHKVSFEHVTRAEDVALVIDVATRQLRQHQAEEALMATERERVLQTAEQALIVAKGAIRK